jgi:peptidoglycan/LPS O-acetylase OafA/YrhL
MVRTTSPVIRLEFVDALRGLAALYVFAYHLLLQPYLNAPRVVQLVANSGVSGVALFFVASAFTLCHALRSRQGEPRAITRFYVRRFFRIAPLFYSWLAFMIWQNGVPDTLSLDVLFAFNFVPSAVWGTVPLSWTLGVEMVFYAVFPLLFRYVNSFGRAAVFVAMSLPVAFAFEATTDEYISSPSVAFQFANCGILAHLPAFAFGMLCYYGLPKLRGRVSGWPFLVVFSGLFADMLYLNVRYPNSLPGGVWGAVYAPLVIGLGLTPIRAVVNPLTRGLGTISYSLYLNHPHVLDRLHSVYRSILQFTYGGSYLVAFVLAAVVLAVFSYVTYRLIERPGMAAGSWLCRRMC